MDWHERYARFPRAFGEEPTPFLRTVFEDPSDHGLSERPLHVLCPGDGYGRNGLWLARRGHRVTGLDLVPAAVEDALAAAIEEGLAYLSVPADVSGAPFPLSRSSSFDVIASAWMRLPDAAARRTWNAECTRRLVPGGAVVLIGGRRVTDAATEQSEWPGTITWTDHSTGDEVRLIGYKHVPPTQLRGSSGVR